MENHTWNVSGETFDFPRKTVITSTVDDGVNPPFDLDVAHVLPSTRKKQNTKLIAAAPELFYLKFNIANSP